MSPHLLTATVVAGPLVASAAEGEETWTPGVLGFLVTLGLVLVCIPLFRSMTGKVRGVQHRGATGPEAGAGSGAEPDERTPDA